MIFHKFIWLLLKISTTYCVSKNSDPFYVVTYYIKWVTTSWKHSTLSLLRMS